MKWQKNYLNLNAVKKLMNHGEQLDKMGYCLEALTCYNCIS